MTRRDTFKMTKKKSVMTDTTKATQLKDFES